MDNTEENEIEAYKLLREDKNHLDSLSWQILYFYFAIAPLFLLVGAELEKESYHGALLFSIIFDVLLGLITVSALLEQRRSWIDAINQAKDIENNTKLGINHFSKYEERKKRSGLGLEKETQNSFKLKSRFFLKLTFMILFLSALVSLGTYLYLQTKVLVPIPKIIISILVLIIVFLVLLFWAFGTEWHRIKHLK